MAKYNKKEVLKLKEVFDDADKDGSGEIDPHELQDSLKKTNLGAEVVDMFKSMDRDGSKKIDFSEYLRVGGAGGKGRAEDDDNHHTSSLYTRCGGNSGSKTNQGVSYFPRCRRSIPFILRYYIVAHCCVYFERFLAAAAVVGG